MFGRVARGVALLPALVLGQVLGLGLVAPSAHAAESRIAFGAEVSDHFVRSGARVFDSVYVSNLPDGAMPTLKWRLLGPISPKDGSCQDLRWGQAPVAARGMFLVPSDIVVATNPVTLTQPGCYSYVAWLTETAKTPVLVRPAGTSDQTVRVRPAR